VSYDADRQAFSLGSEGDASVLARADSWPRFARLCIVMDNSRVVCSEEIVDLSGFGKRLFPEKSALLSDSALQSLAPDLLRNKPEVVVSYLNSQADLSKAIERIAVLRREYDERMTPSQKFLLSSLESKLDRKRSGIEFIEGVDLASEKSLLAKALAREDLSDSERVAWLERINNISYTLDDLEAV